MTEQLPPITSIEELESLRKGVTISTQGRSINIVGDLRFTKRTHINTQGGHIRTRGGAIITDGGFLNGYPPPPIEDQIRLLDQIRERVLDEPEALDMGDWHCGTSHCLAGWAQTLTGEERNAYLAGIKHIPIALPMFFVYDNDLVRAWLERRAYAQTPVVYS